ncbi:MAG: cupin domain-containing protein [Dehalococcoidia bacterium]|nr:cupin domain-containing protein [Dehalococcoidia bacterium]
MPIKVVDLMEMAAGPDAKRTNLINGPRFNAWFHIYQRPGQHDEMHCHNADQTFYCIGGECTMRFPDGGTSVLRPGMVALITGGSFYQLENSGSEPMVMLGVRGASEQAVQTIGYESREELFPREDKAPPRGTSILV